MCNVYTHNISLSLYIYIYIYIYVYIHTHIIIHMNHYLSLLGSLVSLTAPQPRGNPPLHRDPPEFSSDGAAQRDPRPKIA